MRNHIQKAFDSILADPMLKYETKAFLSRKLYHATKRTAFIGRFAVALVCFSLLFLGGGSYAYFTPVSAISIDINPSIELSINRFDRVVSVAGYNEDGKALVPLLSVRHLPYQQAIETILAQESVKGYLADGELLSMTVAGNSEKQSSQMLTALSQYSTQENICCHAADAQTMAGAHGQGLSVGKYSAYLSLYELDPDITVEEVKHLTMRQIRDRIDALSDEELPSQGNGNRHSPGRRHGRSSDGCYREGCN